MKNTPSTLSPRQQQLCQTIETLTASRGFPPSLREVAAEMGVHYTRVAQLAASVEARGALLHEPRVARSWRVVKPSNRGR
jgi:SOS-response transcriptional repressor LexA